MTFVAPARRVDLAEAASIMADAFFADPPTRALIRCPDTERHARTAALFLAMITSGPLDAGTVDVARDRRTGRLLGVAVWHEPGRPSTGTLHYVPQVPGFLRAFGIAGLPRALVAAHACAMHRPAARHWYLQAVGVRGELQGRGIGSRLLRHRLAVADAHGVGAYLESSTDSTSALYRRHGFVALGPITQYPDPAPPTAMWRPPRLPGDDAPPGTAEHVNTPGPAASEKDSPQD